MKPLRFSKETFAYFDEVRHKEDSPGWFNDLGKQQYADHVVVPFTHLIMQMRERFSGLLPGIEFSPRKIVKPTHRRTDAVQGAVVRSKTTAFFAEPATSMFESNPGIYLSFGAAPEDNVYGMGLYDVSSRQMKRLRPAFLANPAAADACIKSSQVRQHWGGLSGDRFQRFPKEYDETAPGAEYLWHKQMLLSKTFTRTSAAKPSFMKEVLDDLHSGIPFLQWLRSTVGVYRKELR